MAELVWATIGLGFHRYYLEDDSGNFQIGPRSGMISVAGTLDRETQDVYVMKVRAGTPGKL